MAKKYSPSGYYIINLDLTGKTSGNSFDCETEDEKILYDVLVKVGNGEKDKPVLLYLLTDNITMVGFGVTGGGEITLQDLSYSEILSIDGVKLNWQEIEL